MAVSGGGGVEEEFAVGCVVEQIETDTHPQQESLTPSRKDTHTLKHAKCKHTHRQTDMQGHTRNTCTHTRWWVGCVCTETHTMCGLAVATADAVHEYFSQTLWQSFHLHGPDVSSWNIYHTGPGRNRPQPHCVRAPVCVTFTSVCVFFVFMLNLGRASVCVCVYSSKWQYLFSLLDGDCQAVERDLCSAHPLPVTGGGTHTHTHDASHSVLVLFSPAWDRRTQEVCTYIHIYHCHTQSCRWTEHIHFLQPLKSNNKCYKLYLLWVHCWGKNRLIIHLPALTDTLICSTAPTTGGPGHGTRQTGDHGGAKCFDRGTWAPPSAS